MSRLVCIGLSHHTAPLDIREGMAVAEGAIPAHLKELGGLSAEAMVLSTCNRYELYLAVPEGPADPYEPIESHLLKRHPAARGHLYRHDAEAALRHLFRVAASLDSLVVGEPQILGQVKDAYDAAVSAGAVGPLLQRAVPRSFQVAKRVRTETAIGKNSASVSSVAVGLASHIFGSLRDHPVLVVGAGKMAELAARHLRQAEVRELWVVNRTRSRPDELAARLSGTAHDFSALEELLKRAAVVLCSTGATEPVIRRDLVARVMKARKGRWLLFVDIAVPRDVEAAVGGLENVYLYDIDALQQVVAGNLEERRREAEAADRILVEELKRFREGERTQGVVPTIKDLRERAHRLAQREVERTLQRLGEASEKDRQLVAQMGEAIVNKLLHGPLVALKRDAGTEGERGLRDLQEAVRLLFSLDEPEPAPEAAREAPKAAARQKKDGGP